MTLPGVAPPAPLPAARPSMPSLAIDAEPTILVVGEGFEKTLELEQALTAHGIYCETASRAVAEYTAVAVAPDIVLLVGDAASTHYDQVVTTLKRALRERMPPIAVVTGVQDLASRLDAFRRGAVAAFTDADQPEQLATKLDKLIKDLSKRGAFVSAELGESTLDELLGLLSQELRAELCDGSEARSGPVRLVLGGGKPLAIALREFVDRVKRNVVSATPLPLPEPEREPTPEPAPERRTRPPLDISGMRLIVADEDAGRADVVAQALRERGAVVLVTNLAPTRGRLQRLRRLDPSALLTGDDQIPGRGLELLRVVRDDYRLRWASLLVLRWAEVWPDEAKSPAIEPLLGTLAALTELEHGAEQRAAAGLSFNLRLESIGPIRLLRALDRCPEPLRFSLDNPRLKVELDLCAGQVERAVARPVDGGPELVGLPALTALSVLHTGHVHVEPREASVDQSPLGAIDELLAQIEKERPPVAPSMFPEGLGTVLPPSMRAPKLPADLVPTEQSPAPAVEPLASEPPRRRTLRLGRFTLPLWLAAASGVALVLLIAFVLTSLGSSTQSSEPSAGSATATPAGGSSATAPTKSAPKTLLERAQSGDSAALDELLAISPEQRSADQAFALARGQQARDRQELERLLGELEADPSRLREREVQRRLLGAARDPLTGAMTLRALTSVDAPESSDLIYEVWTGTRAKTPSSEIAESLAHTEAVKKRASPALAVAIDLRTATSCDAAKQAAQRAITHGDRRALRPLARLTVRRGCGPQKLSDCYPCLRSSDTLRKAIGAVRLRRPPL